MISILGALIRPIAIALFPCLVWSLGVRLGVGRILLVNKKILIGFAALAMVLACAASALLLRTEYVQEALSVLARQGLGRGIRSILFFRIHEIGELSLMRQPANWVSSHHWYGALEQLGLSH